MKIKREEKGVKKEGQQERQNEKTNKGRWGDDTRVKQKNNGRTEQTRVDVLRLFYYTDFLVSVCLLHRKKKKSSIKVKEKEENGTTGETGIKIVVTLKITCTQGGQPTYNGTVLAEKEKNYILG